MTVKELTCIICPKGCTLRVELDGTDVVSVSGNTCPRGKQYAIDECTHPMRTVTSTVKDAGGGVVPVKTNRTIPKEMMFACMKEINRTIVSLPIHIGDVLIENVAGTGADVVATANME